VEVVIIPEVRQLEVGVIPAVEDLPDGGVEIAVYTGEE